MTGTSRSVVNLSPSPVDRAPARQTRSACIPNHPRLALPLASPLHENLEPTELDPHSYGKRLAELDQRQDDVLERLDELEKRILALIDHWAPKREVSQLSHEPNEADLADAA